jgi:hypothetical protein
MLGTWRSFSVNSCRTSGDAVKEINYLLLDEIKTWGRVLEFGELFGAAVLCLLLDLEDVETNRLGERASMKQ